MSRDRSLLFGAIADDYTGASDLAGMLEQEGIRTVQVLGIQPDEFILNLGMDYDAIVVALKSRSIDPKLATSYSLKALDQLKQLNTRQIQFKYCSTFDSTKDGNIGPVTESLMDALNIDFTVAVPSLPINGRTQYMGHLFVGGQLLSDSHMRHHPINPMLDSNLVSHLQAQTKRQVGLIPYSIVDAGSASIAEEIERLREKGINIALVDAIFDRDLEQIAEAIADLPLITGGSGLAMKLPSLWAKKDLLKKAKANKEAYKKRSGTLILSGSCSKATLQQLELFKMHHKEWLKIDVNRLLDNSWRSELDRLLAGLSSMIKQAGYGLVYSSATIEEREALFNERRDLSVDVVSRRIEEAMGELAYRAVEEGSINNLVIAGGETSGAVLDRLGIEALEIGETIDPGVPSLYAIGKHRLTFVCKSGNFGSTDFFEKTIRKFNTEDTKDTEEVTDREMLK
jgi:3-dehydrotetronate 4-kinase